MSISSRQRSPRNARLLAAAPGPPADEPAAASSAWDERVAQEVRRQEFIEATFDRAEAYERLGDFERALEWLDRAVVLGGGLPPAYRSRRALWVRATARRPRPAAGGWRNRHETSGEAVP
jgi:tetratricopeptide (TPR) repeat protein